MSLYAERQSRAGPVELPLFPSVRGKETRARRWDLQFESARSEAESPAAIKRRMARDAVKVSRDARIAERRATKLAVEARQAAALSAGQVAEAAAREAALKAEQEARDAEFAEQTAREAALEAERQAARDARYAARKAKKRKGR
jgi:hypothetical protein